MALSVALGAALLTYYLSSRVTPTYESSATLLGSQPNSSLQNSFGITLVTAPALDMRAFGAAATSSPLLQTALESMGLGPVSRSLLDSFKRNVKVRAEVLAQSSLLHITVTNANRETAAEAANALAQALVSWDVRRATESLETAISTLEGEIASLDSQIAYLGSGAADDQVAGLSRIRSERVLHLNAARALRSSAVGQVALLEPAAVATHPVSPKPATSGAIAFILGLFAVYLIVFLRAALDLRFRSSEELATTTGLPILSEFPRLLNAGDELPKEASDYLQAGLQFATVSDYPKVLLVTSAVQAEGKSSVAIALAKSYARTDYRVLLIDADMRKPKLTARVGASGSPQNQLAAHLASPKSQPQPATVHHGGAAFDILPTSTEVNAPLDLLTGSIGTLLARLRDQYDVIVIDSPPVLPVADSLVIAPHTTGVVMVAGITKVDKRRILAAMGLFERMGVRILGVVATGLEQKTMLRTGVGYGYGYEHSEKRRSSNAQTDPLAAAGQLELTRKQHGD